MWMVGERDFFFFLPLLNRCGLRLDYLVSARWLSGCDHTAYSPAQAAMMEMSNAQSVFGLSLCAMCVCDCWFGHRSQNHRECFQHSWSCWHHCWKQHSLPSSVFLSACVFLLFLSLLLVCFSSLMHINSHIQMHILCRIQMVWAAGLVFNVL